MGRKSKNANRLGIYCALRNLDPNSLFSDFGDGLVWKSFRRLPETLRELIVNAGAHVHEELWEGPDEVTAMSTTVTF